MVIRVGQNGDCQEISRGGKPNRVLNMSNGTEDFVNH